MLIDPSYILYLKQADLLEVVARALGLEGTWFEKLFERISVETLLESFFWKLRTLRGRVRAFRARGSLKAA